MEFMITSRRRSPDLAEPRRERAPASPSVIRRSPPKFDALTAYLEDIAAYPLLTRTDESELARGIRAGDAEALERLVCANLRFVVSVAKKYKLRGVPLPDLINDGNLGLMRAAVRFDETKGVKFISYAVWWIRQAIFQSLADHGHAVRIPLSRAETLHQISRRAEELRRELGREPTQRELAEEMEIGEAELAETMPLARAQLSLDAPMSEGEDASLLDYLAIEDDRAGDDVDFDAGLAHSLAEALTVLRGREEDVLRMHFGLGGNEPMTLESIGERFGVTRERIRQIKERAIGRLRTSRHSETLAAFRGDG